MTAQPFMTTSAGETPAGLKFALPEPTLRSLDQLVGPLPQGDTPVAWYLSANPGVFKAYDKWERHHKIWRDKFTELREISGFPPGTKVSITGDNTLNGVFADPELCPTWWRKTKTAAGYLVPRQRTKAEKDSEVRRRFLALVHVPRAVDYVPGIPHSVWIPTPDGGTEVYPVSLRKPGNSVLAFIGADPDRSQPPFQVGPEWSRMKMSMYHALRERQGTRGA